MKDAAFQNNIQYSHAGIQLSVNYNSPNTSITSQEPRVLFSLRLFLLMAAWCGRTVALPSFQNETVCTVVRAGGGGGGGGDYTLAIMICQCYFYGERLFQTHNWRRGET